MDGYQGSIDVVIDLQRFPYHLYDVRTGPNVTACGAGFVITRAHPVCHPECVRQVAFLLDIYFCRVVAVIQESGTYPSAYLHRNILCPLERAVQEAT